MAYLVVTPSLELITAMAEANMLNYVLAWGVILFLILYLVVEMGWGGSIRGASMWPITSVKRKPIWWLRWRRDGLYPPEPPEDKGPKKPIAPKPKAPEHVDG